MPFYPSGREDLDVCMILPEDYMDDSNNNSNNKYNDNVKGIEQLLNITSIRNKDDWHDKKKLI